MVKINLQDLLAIVRFVIKGKVEGISLPIWLIFLFIFICQDVFYRNSQQWVDTLKPNLKYSIICIISFFVGTLLLVDQHRLSEFLYFQF